MFGVLLGEAKDPEDQVPLWLKGATPLGIKVPIEPAGVFPATEPKGIGPTLEKLITLMEHKPSEGEFKNYTSYQDNAQEADAQLKLEQEAGFLQWAATREELEAEHGELVMSRVGCIISEKDGRRKIRLIHDLRRSLVNSKVTIRERLVLPRLSDLVEGS